MSCRRKKKRKGNDCWGRKPIVDASRNIEKSSHASTLSMSVAFDAHNIGHICAPVPCLHFNNHLTVFIIGTVLIVS
jgi:hypothetical protein